SNAVKTLGVKCVVVDYAQLLRSEGRSRYEEVTNTSIALRQLASSHKIIVLALCQLSRAIESRPDFIPMVSDIKDSGQLDQDADVIIFMRWPWKLDPSEDQSKFHFFVAKNRNRPINKTLVVCRFNPARQMFTDPIPEVLHPPTPATLYAGEGDMP